MKILYITYDGLLDPLGSSQILPYLYGINDPSKAIFVISFEKSKLYKKFHKKLNNELQEKNIYWKPLLFSNQFGLIGKLWDFLKIYIFSIRITVNKKINIVHARGHVAAQVAGFLKVFFKVKFIFDFRGLWADERVDKGGWNLNNIFDKLQYRYFKNKEKQLLMRCDHTIVLTKKVVSEICKISKIEFDKITVIPCCADFDHFTIQTEEKKLNIRQQLKIPKNSIVIGYLGSIGQMYLINDYLKFLDLLHYEYRKSKQHIYGLIITNDLFNAKNAINQVASDELKENILVSTASRNEVPKFLHSLDVLISFISVTYARQAASPTKIAESFATGIPIISNAGVGDVDDQLLSVHGGLIIEDTSIKNLQETIIDLNDVLNLDRMNIRAKAKEFLSLDIAIQRYKDVYSKVNFRKND